MGPWQKKEKEEIPDDILKARNELNNYMMNAKNNNNDQEEKIKNTGKEGINPDNL